MPYPQVAGSPSRCTKNNTPLIEWAKVWRGGGVELCLLCWFRIVRNSGQALSRILAFAVVWVGASLRRLCATALVHPCTTRTVRVRPPAPKKAGLYLFVVVKVGRGCRIVLALLVSHPCETLGKHYHASLRLRSLGSARPCADFVRPLSCILCTFMNALWALRPCKAFGRSFYKASVPYPQVAGSPTHQHTKSVTPLIEWGYTFWCRWRGSNPHGIATNGF